MSSMTRKIAISVPDDVAERLAEEPNVSAYITEAVRGRMDSERAREFLTAIGFDITDEGIAQAGEELDRAAAGITPELRAHAARLAAEIASSRARARADTDELIERLKATKQRRAAA